MFKHGRDPIDGALRAGRPEPSDELVAALGGRVAATTVMRSHRGSRLAFAAAVSVFMLGTFASFGGLAYAATNAKTANSVVQRTSKSAAADEYGADKVAVVAKPAKKTTTTVAVASATASAPAAAKSDTLPFTGFGLGFTAALGLLLVSLGIVLRRREARE